MTLSADKSGPEQKVAEANRLRDLPGSGSAIARLLHEAGRDYARNYRWWEALTVFAESLEVLRAEDGPAQDLADTGFELGQALIRVAEYGRAEEVLSTSRANYRKGGQPQDEAKCTLCLGDIRLRRYDYDAAHRFYSEALGIYNRLQDLQGEGLAIQSLGDVALSRCEYEAARANFEASVSIFRDTGNILGEANSLCFLGDVGGCTRDCVNAVFKK